MHSPQPRIDAHQHFWLLERGDYHWMSPDLKPLYRDHLPADLAPLLARAGIDRTVLVQAAATVEETHFMLDIAQRTPFVAGVVGWADLAARGAPDVMAALAQDPKLRGFRPMIQDIPDDGWMLRPELTPAFRALVELGLTFDALVFPRHLPNLLTLLERHPDLRTVVDHGAKPQIATGDFERWAHDTARIAGETAALCKLSGLVTEAGPDWDGHRLRPYVDHLLACFGSDRLIWGSDWPVLNLVARYDEWWQATGDFLAGLSDAQRDAILGGNAARFYRL